MRLIPFFLLATLVVGAFLTPTASADLTITVCDPVSDCTTLTPVGGDLHCAFLVDARDVPPRVSGVPPRCTLT